MAEVRIVEHAERSPSGCVACGDQAGPFIDFNLTLYQLASASGPVDVDGALYLCVGTAERPGCLIQWARKSGLMVDVAEQRALLERLGEQESELTELRDKMLKKTITLADVQKLKLLEVH